MAKNRLSVEDSPSPSNGAGWCADPASTRKKREKSTGITRGRKTAMEEGTSLDEGGEADIAAN